MWQEGTIGIPVKKTVEKEYIAVHYTIKVFDEPSKFGINHGNRPHRKLNWLFASC